jgi:hypothetical protein
MTAQGSASLKVAVTAPTSDGSSWGNVAADAAIAVLVFTADHDQMLPVQ